MLQLAELQVPVIRLPLDAETSGIHDYNLKIPDSIQEPASQETEKRKPPWKKQNLIYEFIA